MGHRSLHRGGRRVARGEGLRGCARRLPWLRGRRGGRVLTLVGELAAQFVEVVDHDARDIRIGHGLARTAEEVRGLVRERNKPLRRDLACDLEFVNLGILEVREDVGFRFSRDSGLLRPLLLGFLRLEPLAEPLHLSLGPPGLLLGRALQQEASGEVVIRNAQLLEHGLLIVLGQLA